MTTDPADIIAAAQHTDGWTPPDLADRTPPSPRAESLIPHRRREYAQGGILRTPITFDTDPDIREWLIPRTRPVGPPSAAEIMANIHQVVDHLRQADEAYERDLRTLAADGVSAEAVAAYAVERTLKRFLPGLGMRPEELALAIVDALRATGHLDDAACATGLSATLPASGATVEDQDADGPEAA